MNAPDSVPAPHRTPSRVARWAAAFAVIGAVTAGCAQLDPIAPDRAAPGVVPDETTEPLDEGTTTPAPTTGTPTGEPTIEPSAVGSGDALEALSQLRLEREPPRHSYNRDLFDHWVDDNGNGCDTRCEVLGRDLDPTIGTSGGWLSRYDGVTATHPGDLHIDHVVPLAEAWDSGAHAWDEQRRRAFANDLAESRALIAVSAESNMTKSDRDPGQWLPHAPDLCRYADAWIAVKVRWDLAVDAVEADTLSDILLDCAGTHPWIPPAIAPAGSSPGVAPNGAQQPAAPTTAGGGAGGGPFANCAAARAAGAAPVHSGDPGYGPHLDGDSDGVGCE